MGDMLAQGRGGRQAEDEVETVGVAPVSARWAALMAVGSDQDRVFGPVAPNRPHEAAQVGRTSPARPLGRPENRTNEPAIAIEHHDPLETVFVVMMRLERPATAASEC